MIRRTFYLVLTLSLLSSACAPKRVPEASSTVEELPLEPSEEVAPPRPEDGPTEQLQAKEVVPAPAAFQRLDATEGFSVMLPKDAAVQRKAVPLNKTGTLQAQIVTISANLDGVLYSVTRVDYPETMATKRGPEKMLKEVREGLAAQLKGTVRDQRPVTLAGHPGEEFTVVGATNTIKARSAAVANQVYSLIAVSAGAAEAPRSAEFLGSLELAAPPPAPAPAPASGPAPVPAPGK